VGLNTELVVYSSDPLGAYKDRGRRAGKQPPPAAMLAYVKHRGLRIAGSRAPVLSQQKSLAFLIGRKIGKGNMNAKRPRLYTKVLVEQAGVISSSIKRLNALVAARLNRG
jgi:hypothetical protein